MVAAIGCPDGTLNLDELLKMRKALEDADYWDHRRCPPPIIRRRSKLENNPASYPPPGYFDQTYDRPPLPVSSKSKLDEDTTSNSTSKLASRSGSRPQSTLEYKSKEGKENQLVLPTHPRSASKASSLVQSPGRRPIRRRDIVITALGGVLTILKHVAAMVGIPYVSPIASLLLGIINIRNEMIQYHNHSAVLTDKLEMIATFLNGLGQELPKARDVPQNLRNVFRTFESRLDRVKRELEEIKKEAMPVVNRIISRKDIAQRLSQCDDKLSNLLQVFQTRLAIDTCFKLDKIYAKLDSSRG